MRLNPATVVADAWAALRRDRAVLMPVAGLFLFMPSYALALLVPRPPIVPDGAEAGDAAAQVWARAFAQWVAAHGGGYLGAYAVAAWGTAALYALYLDRVRPDVAVALRHGGRALPRLMLAGLLVALPVIVGLRLWLVPGLWLLGRLLLVGPVLLAEPRTGAAAAIVRSVRLTSGAGLPLAALIAATLATGLLAQAPLLWLDDWLRAATGGGNPVALAIVDAGAAAVSMATALASALIAIAAYRRLTTAP